MVVTNTGEYMTSAGSKDEVGTRSSGPSGSRRQFIAGDAEAMPARDDLGFSGRGPGFFERDSVGSRHSLVAWKE